MKFPFSRFVISGESMFPTLKPGQSVVTFNWSYFFSKPRVGELVVLMHDKSPIIKRIKQLKADKIFVIGDNPTKSTDSRNFGKIDVSDLIGRVVIIL